MRAPVFITVKTFHCIKLPVTGIGMNKGACRISSAVTEIPMYGIYPAIA